MRDIVGWKRPNGTRRYRTVHIEIPKGNGKTPFCAALALAFLFIGAEPAAEIYSCAGEKEQARIMHDDGKNLMTEDLVDACEIFKNSIVYGKSSWKVISSDAYSKHGYRPWVVIFDELHVQPDRGLWDTVRLGLSKRSNSILIAVTTAGVYDEESLYYQEHEYAVQCIADPTFDPHHYAVIYAADPEADWTDPEVGRACNPGMGRTLNEEAFRETIRHAQNNPAEQATVKQLHFNIIAQPVISNGFPMEHWQACGELEVIAPLGAKCWIGLDLSSKGEDLTALAALFDHGDEGGVSVLPYYWTPEKGIAERKRRHVFDYPRYVKEELITATPDAWVDLEYARKKVQELGEKYDIQGVYYDPMNASQFIKWMNDDGFQVIEVTQSWTMLSEPSKLLVNLVADHKFRHGDNAVLTWNAQNTDFRVDLRGYWMPGKDRKQRKKIDGISATINALKGARLLDQVQGPVVEVWGA